MYLKTIRRIEQAGILEIIDIILTDATALSGGNPEYEKQSTLLPSLQKIIHQVIKSNYPKQLPSELIFISKDEDSIIHDILVEILPTNL